jgi:hypothetical protein
MHNRSRSSRSNRTLVALSGLALLLGILTATAVARLGDAASVITAYQCVGSQSYIFNNWNSGAVDNGGTDPTFSTNGQPYCLIQIADYHWNGGSGAVPGMISLVSEAGTLGPYQATGTSGQDNAPDVNWIAAPPSSSQPVIIDGTYACDDSDPGTWSQNSESGNQGFCKVLVQQAQLTQTTSTGPAPTSTGSAPTTTGAGNPTMTGPSGTCSSLQVKSSGDSSEKAVCKPKPKPTSKPKRPTGYKCMGAPVRLFNNSNVYGVQNGGTPPSFSTKGHSYCVRRLITYHWNNGLGAAPGTIGLGVVSGLGGAGRTLGPYNATGSSGQGGARNINWTASISTSGKPVVINGTYRCVDSGSSTWSQNRQSGGHGFCQVYGIRAMPTSGTPPKPKPKKPKPKAPKAKCKKGKLGIAAAPDTGKPPLKVTFALCSPKVVQWRIDYGDGQSKVGNRSPPPSITHTYRLQGDFRPTLTVLRSTSSFVASHVSTSVSVHLAQLISLIANPASGNPPLRVAFSMATTAKNVTGWTLDYGDGTRSSGPGKPPAALAHTYSSAGSYTATFSVKVGANAVDLSLAQVTVGGGTPPVLSMTASPTSGAHPLHVTFRISVNIPGRIVSWEVRFGDGQTAAGPGQPPASVRHTYSRKGTYAAYLLVSQQQQYGGVLYVYPQGGLILVVR